LVLPKWRHTTHSGTPSYQVWCYQNGDTQHTVGHLVIRFGVTKMETHNTQWDT